VTGTVLKAYSDVVDDDDDDDCNLFGVIDLWRGIYVSRRKMYSKCIL
jgi:hypothetical protein